MSVLDELNNIEQRHGDVPESGLDTEMDDGEKGIMRQPLPPRHNEMRETAQF